VKRTGLGLGLCVSPSVSSGSGCTLHDGNFKRNNTVDTSEVRFISLSEVAALPVRHCGDDSNAYMSDLVQRLRNARLVLFLDYGNMDLFLF